MKGELCHGGHGTVRRVPSRHVEESPGCLGVKCLVAVGPVGVSHGGQVNAWYGMDRVVVVSSVIAVLSAPGLFCSGAKCRGGHGKERCVEL